MSTALFNFYRAGIAGGFGPGRLRQALARGGAIEPVGITTVNLGEIAFGGQTHVRGASATTNMSQCIVEPLVQLPPPAIFILSQLGTPAVTQKGVLPKERPENAPVDSKVVLPKVP